MQLLSPEGLGLYSQVQINDAFKVTLPVSKTSSVQFSLQPKGVGTATCYNITDGIIEFTITPSKVTEYLVRSPQVSANGTSVFKTLFLEKTFFDYGGASATILGSISFNVIYADTFTLASNFVIGPKANLLQTQQIEIWSEWGSIPWINLSLKIAVLAVVIISLFVGALSYKYYFNKK